MDNNENLNQDNNSLNNQNISSNSNAQNNPSDELTKEKLQREEAVNDTKKVAGKSMQVAGKGAEVAGKGVVTAGKGLSKASSAAGKAMSAIPVVGAPLGTAVGVAGNAAGKSMQLAGKGAQAAGKATNNAGKKVENYANQNQNPNNNQNSASDTLKKGAKKARNAVKNGVKERKNNTKRKALNTVGRVAEKVPGIGTAIGVRRRAANLKNHLGNKKNNADEKTDGENNNDNNSKSVTSKIKPKSSSVEGVVNKVVGKALKRKILSLVISIAIFLSCVCIIIGAVWGPISWALDKLNKAIDTAANIHESYDNFMNGLGFQNSEDAFAEELQKLDDEHDNELNIPLLMSALFYDDMHSNGQEGIANEDENDENSLISLSMAASYIKSKIKESNETISEDGLVYSSNKIYRLRKLARHMFDDEVFGSGCGKELKTEDISDYIDEISDRIGSSFLDAIKSFLLIGVNSANVPDFIESITQMAKGDELFTTTDTGARIEDLGTNLVDVFKAILAPFTNFKSIRIAPGDPDCSTSGICVDYYTYGFSKKTYVQYLKDYYVPNMPEFKKYITSNSDKETDIQVEKVVKEIVEEAANYEDIFGRQSKSAETYSPSCQGDVDEDIISKIVKPVQIQAGTVVKFKSPYSYGVSNGVKHNGLDLNSETTGNKEGDSVYSIAKGKVVSTTNDGSYKCEDCKENSGWIKIRYNIALGKNKYTIYAIYGGINKNDTNFTKLKAKSTVKQNQIIGKIGSADVSDSDIAGLHFELKDKKTDNILNPTNLFIDCSPADGAGIKVTSGPVADQVYTALKNAAKSKIIDERYGGDIQIAGILGNMQQESTLKFVSIEHEIGKTEKEILSLPKAINPEILYGQTSPGFGLVQWSGERRDNLYKYAKAQNKKWYDADVQLSFLIGEFSKKGGAKVGKTNYADYQWTRTQPQEEQLLNAKNISDAVIGYEKGYERCRVCNESNRINYAKSFYDKIKSGKISIIDSSTDGGDATSVSTEGAEDPSEEEPNATADTTKVISSLDNFIFIGDSRIHGVSDKLSALGNNIKVYGLDSSTPLQWRKKIKGKMKKDEDFNFTLKVGNNSVNVSLPKDKDAEHNFVIMLGVNATSQFSDLKKIYKRLHKNYPNSMIFAASVYPVGSNYTYNDGKDALNSKIKELNDKIKDFAGSNKWIKYIDITSGLVDSNGDLKSEYQDGEGLHLSTEEGKNTLVNNFRTQLVGKSLIDNDDEQTAEDEDSCDNDINSLFKYINVDFDDEEKDNDNNSKTSSSNSKDSNDTISAYLKEMKAIADDNTHGYSQANRTRGVDFDCSSFIYYSLANAKVIKNENSPFDTHTEGDFLKKHGFKELDYDRKKLKRGDIVVDPATHTTTIYSVSNSGQIQQISAHQDYDGASGDSKGNEINISNFSEGTHNYTKIYRYEGKK